MPNFSNADGRFGNITGGAIGATSATILMKVQAGRWAARRETRRAAGFGDGGNDYHSEGLNTHAFVCTGWLTTGTTGVLHFVSTTGGTVTVNLVIGGSGTNTNTITCAAILNQYDIDQNYQFGDVPCTVGGVVEGAVTTSVP